MRVGLDVGGTKVDAVAVDQDDRVVARVRRATGQGVQGVIGSITEALAALRAEVPAPITSLGVGIPGLVEPGTTLVRHSVNLGVDELDLGLALTPIVGAPVRVENDVKAAAVGAATLHPGTTSMAYLNLGTGIAAGIVIDGALHSGARGGAGEVGHLSVDPAGPLCKCGQRGCVEAFAGGAAVAQRWGRAAVLPVLDVFDAADAGHAEAITIRDGIAQGITGGIYALVLTADVESVVLGGGLTALGDRLEQLVKARLTHDAQQSAFLRSLALTERIELLPTGSPAAALGAALIGAGITKGTLAHG